MVDNFNFTPSLIIDENIEITKIRELPLQGELFVKENDFVTSDKLIAKTKLVGDLVLLKVARELGLEPQDIEDNYLINVSDAVKPNQVLVRKKGLFNIFNSEYLCSYDGIVEFISKETGTIGIRLSSKNFNLYSYITGKVIKCEDNKEITIKTNASLIQGVFGVGGEKIGKLCKIDDKIYNDIIQYENINSNKDFSFLENCVLFYSIPPSIDFLRKLSNLKISGLIIPSISSKVLSAFLGYDIGVAVTGDENINFTIIITEGFGDMKFNPRVMEIFEKNINNQVSINGVTQIRAGAIRPEIIIFDSTNNIKKRLDENVNSKKDITNGGICVGTKIKVLKDPFFGHFGIVTKIINDEVTFESGVICRALQIKLENGEITLVPKANIEVI